MARSSDPRRPPSPAKDGFGKEGAGLLGVLFTLPCALVIERHRLHLQLVQSAVHQPFSRQQVQAAAMPLGKSHKRWLSSGERCKPDPSLALLLPAGAPLL